MIDITKFQLTIEKEDERVVKVVHVHPVLFVVNIVVFLFFAATPIALFFSLYSEIMQLTETVQAFLIVITSIYYLILLTVWYISWLDLYLDMGIITTERVIDIDQSGLIGRKVSQLYLENIQDVSANQKGFLASFFDYGNVLIQSAGSVNNFLWEKVKSPFALAEFILDLHNEKKPNITIKAAEEKNNP